MDLANIARGTYFLFALNVPIAIIPFSNKFKNNGTEVKKLLVVTM
jgi:hypothetical protein